jgi:hypothetical protein
MGMPPSVYVPTQADLEQEEFNRSFNETRRIRADRDAAITELVSAFIEAYSEPKHKTFIQKVLSIFSF